MHLLLITSTSVRTSDAPFLLAAAFERKDHRVTILPVDFQLPALAEVGYRKGGFDDPVYRTLYQRHARKVAAATGPDAVLVYGSNWSLEPETLEFLRYKLGAQTGLWEINQRIVMGSQARSMPLYDHVFCLDSYYVPVLQAAGLRCVEHLCAAADPEEHRPLQLTDTQRERYQADVSFIGTHHKERAEMLGALSSVTPRVRIYGRNWEQAGPPVSTWVSNEPVYGWKKTLIYNASRFSFHVRGPHMLSGENFRVFEVAACGGVPLARTAPDLLRSFEPGSEVLLFETADDLCSTVRHYLRRPEALSSIGAAARSRVIGEHTYDHRAAVILDHFESCR
jgi:spore maturation protein CgeB